MQVIATSVKLPSELGPSSRRCPDRMAPATTVPDTTEPTPFTSNVWSTCAAQHVSCNRGQHAAPRNRLQPVALRDLFENALLRRCGCT